MRKPTISLTILSFAFIAISLGGCATIENATSLVKPKPVETSPEMLARANPISSAIAEWVSEEAQDANIKSIQLVANSDFPSIHILISDRLKASGLEITQSEAANNIKLTYQVTQTDSQILIIIRSNSHEALRLFAMTENNTITPSSPLTIRQNQ